MGWRSPANGGAASAVAVHRTGGTKLSGLANYVLMPCGDAEVEYLAPAFWTAPGALGPLGTVQRQGTAAYAIWVVFAVLGSILLVVLALGITIPLVYLR